MLKRTLGFVLAMVSLSLTAQTQAMGQFIDIFPQSEEDIRLILSTLDETINSAETEAPPIVMMLHGPQADRFLRSSYASNKMLVDQTAKLAAYGVLEVQICETWLRRNNHSRDELFPFVAPVPFGQDVLTRLAEEEGYTEFSVDL